MRTPIAHALAWPERIDSGVPGLDFSVPLRLDFEPPDFGWAPCLRLGYEAARAGGTLPTVLNAANEVVVAAFLDRRAKFSAIPRVVEETLSRSVQREAADLDTILDEDAAAREIATALAAERGGDGSGTQRWNSRWTSSGRSPRSCSRSASS